MTMNAQRLLVAREPVTTQLVPSRADVLVEMYLIRWVTRAWVSEGQGAVALRVTSGVPLLHKDSCAAVQMDTRE